VKHFVLPLAFAALLAMPVVAHAEGLNADQKKEVEAIVHQYLLDHGDTVIESVNNYQAKQEETANKESAVKAKEMSAKLKDNKDVPAAGNPNGDVLVVEFFDYNCGYCKKAYPEVQELLKSDKNVRVVFFDMPILGPESYTASKWALAAAKQNKYWEFHQAVMGHQGALDDSVLEKAAKDVGIDMTKLKKDIDDPSIEATIKDHLKMAQDMKIQGTPGFMIGEQIFRGYIPLDQMKDAVKTARDAKKDS